MTDLPQGWAWSTLDELVSPEPRSITDGPFGSNLKSDHYTSSGARVIRLQNIGDGKFIDDRAFISADHFASLRQHEAIEGDLIVASLSDNPPRCCILPDLASPAIVKADCIRVRTHDLVETKWILSCLLSPEIKKYCGLLIKGVGRPRLGLRQIRNIPIPVPPLAEQRRIVTTLEDHLSRLDAGERYVAVAAEKVRSLMSSAREHILSSRKFVDSGAARLERWPTATLSDVVDRIEAGRSFGGSAVPARQGEWGIIKISAVTWGEFRETENKKVSDISQVDSRYEIHAGDILVSRANTKEYVGAPVLVRDTRSRLLLSDKTLRIVPKEGISPEWLVETLSSPSVRRQISDRATGTKDSMRNISQSSLLQTRIPLPTRTWLSEIASQLQRVTSLAQQQSVEISKIIDKSAQLRRSLLAEAFVGRLVPQEPNDEPASVLLERITAERAAAPKPTRKTTQRSAK